VIVFWILKKKKPEEPEQPDPTPDEELDEVTLPTPSFALPHEVNNVSIYGDPVDITGFKTISFAFKLPPDANLDSSVISNYPGTSDRTMLHIGLNQSRKTYFQMLIKPETNSEDRYTIDFLDKKIFPNTYWDLTWKYITMVFQPQDLQVYLGTRLINAETTVTGGSSRFDVFYDFVDTPHRFSVLKLGKLKGDTRKNGDLNIKDVKIFSEALNFKQVQKLYKDSIKA
jgi:hypothetical protein